MKITLKYILALSFFLASASGQHGESQTGHGNDADHHNESAETHEDSHSAEGHDGHGMVDGNLIIHHLMDNRVFELFNPLHPTHPIAIELFEEGGEPFLGITKRVVMMWIAAVLLILFFTLGYKHNKKVQTGFGNLLEVFIVFVRDELVYPNLGKKEGDKFLPLILTFFFFIILVNLLGMIPGTATATGAISVTVGLAIITFFTYIIYGNKDFWKHIFATPGVPFWLLPIMVPAEVFGLFTKPFALAIRLFANMNAGHIIILAFIGIIINLQNYWIALGSIPMAIAISMLELFVAFLQGYIFALLSSIFIGMAVVEHEHEGH